MLKLGRFNRDLREFSNSRDSFTITPDIQASVHEDGIVLLHIPTGRVFQSNRTGARIWQALSGGLQPDAIATEISGDYGVPQDLAARDTDSFLTALEQHGFVTRTGNARS
jgi:hypothetical protein